MKVIIPVFKGCVSASVVGMMDILQLTENFYYHLPIPKKKWFSVSLMSIDGDKIVHNNGFDIACTTTLAASEAPDLVIVPAMVGNFPLFIEEHAPFIEWMKKQYHKGTVLCSTCTGAFLVAATGHLDGKEATTSWFASNDFRALFPKVTLTDEKIIVDNGTIITGGATMSFQNLCIYLIEKYYGAEIGNYAAKMFLVEKGKTSQLTYAIFNTQKEHGDVEILKTQHFIEQNAADKLVISSLANHSAMAERTFIRRFKSATGNTPSEYIQRVKVELAKKLLEKDKNSIQEICYETGYEDQSYFRNVFKKYTGLTPVDYKKQFTFRL